LLKADDKKADSRFRCSILLVPRGAGTGMAIREEQSSSVEESGSSDFTGHRALATGHWVMPDAD